MNYLNRIAVPTPSEGGKSSIAVRASGCSCARRRSCRFLCGNRAFAASRFTAFGRAGEPSSIGYPFEVDTMLWLTTR